MPSAVCHGGGIFIKWADLLLFLPKNALAGIRNALVFGDLKTLKNTVKRRNGIKPRIRKRLRLTKLYTVRDTLNGMLNVNQSGQSLTRTTCVNIKVTTETVNTGQIQLIVLK